MVENTDFNLDEDYVAPSVLHTGEYNVNVTSVSFEQKKMGLVFQLVTQGNDEVRTDGETPADGMTLFYRLWIPREEDRDTIGSNGMSKWQNKVNMLKRAFDNMGIEQRTLSDILEAVDNQDWIGLECKAKVELKAPDEYNPDMYNEVRSLKSTA